MEREREREKEREGESVAVDERKIERVRRSRQTGDGGLMETAKRRDSEKVGEGERERERDSERERDEVTHTATRKHEWNTEGLRTGRSKNRKRENKKGGAGVCERDRCVHGGVCGEI